MRSIYQEATTAILAGFGSELKADVELSGCSLKSESELDQEKAKCSLQHKSRARNQA